MSDGKRGMKEVRAPICWEVHDESIRNTQKFVKNMLGKYPTESIVLRRRNLKVRDWPISERS